MFRTPALIASAAIAAAILTACSSGTAAVTSPGTAQAASTSYVDPNGFACAYSQAENGYCPEDQAAATPYDAPSSAAAATAASSAPAPKHPAQPSAPAPAPSTSPAAAAPPSSPGCYPISDEGTCYEPGEYCRDDDHGVSGIAGDGESITCEDNDGWRWEPSS